MLLKVLKSVCVCVRDSVVGLCKKTSDTTRTVSNAVRHRTTVLYRAAVLAAFMGVTFVTLHVAHGNSWVAKQVARGSIAVKRKMDQIAGHMEEIRAPYVAKKLEPVPVRIESLDHPSLVERVQAVRVTVADVVDRAMDNLADAIAKGNTKQIAAS